MKNKKIDNVELLLSKLDKRQLGDFIRKECMNNGQFQDRFLALGTDHCSSLILTVTLLA